MTRIAFAALCLSCAAVSAAPHTTDKLAGNARVRAALAQLQSEDTLTLREQIEIAEIPAPTFAEATRAKDYLRRLQALGLKNAYIDGTGNVIALRKGTRGTPLLVVSAHLDTVFPEGTDVKVTQREGRYYGRGLTDDSRGLAAMLAVIRNLQKSGIQTTGDVMFVATVGEEGLGDLRGVKGLFQDHPHIDGFISIDGTAGDEGHTIVANATGSHRWEISFTGPGGHSYGAFGRPSAIHAMGRAIARIGEVRTPAEPKTTFTVGVVSGGTSVNTIASDAKMLIDIRSNEAQALLATEQQIMAAIEAGVTDENARWASQGIRFARKLLGERPAGMASKDSPVPRVAQQAWKSLGLKPPPFDTASTDANVAIARGITAATISGGGLGGGEHGPDEWYQPVDAWQGPQTILLTTLALAGMDKVTRPELPARVQP
jgi:tripeptide aminopeptidase